MDARLLLTLVILSVTVTQGKEINKPYAFNLDASSSSNCKLEDHDCQPKSRATDCLPSCSGHHPGDFVEDPLDCTQFYVCVDENVLSDHPIQCLFPTGVFDPIEGKCIEGSTCEPSCRPTCNLKCHAANENIAYPNNCNSYFTCNEDFSLLGPYYCPTFKPYFNGKTCVEDANECCSYQCNPYCDADDVQIIDPYDCTKYYICLEEGEPDEMYHFTCSPGETFQTSSSTCAEYAHCFILCKEMSSSSTTSTTTPHITTTTPPITTTTTSTISSCNTVPYTSTTSTTSFPYTTTTTTRTTRFPYTTTTRFPYTTTTTTNCITSLVCPGKGNYAKCPTCHPDYFHCQEEGQGGILLTCDAGELFNSNPDYPFCVLESECPYRPPSHLSSD